MEKEWEIEKQRIAEQREKSLYMWKNEQEKKDPWKVRQQELSEKQAETSIAAQQASTSASIASTKLAQEKWDIEQEQIALDMQTPVLMKDAEGNTIRVPKSKVTEMTESGARLLDPIEMAKEVKLVEMDLQSQMVDKEFEATLKKRDRIIEEAKKLGMPENELNQLSLQLISGVKDADDKGVSTTDLFKAYNDTYNTMLEMDPEAKPEKRMALWQQAVSEVNASFQAANVTTGRTTINTGEKITPVQVAAEAIADGLHENPNWEAEIQKTYPASVASAIIQEMKVMLKEEEKPSALQGTGSLFGSRTPTPPTGSSPISTLR